MGEERKTKSRLRNGEDRGGGTSMHDALKV